PLFLRHARRTKIPPFEKQQRFLTFTGTSFYPFLLRFLDRLKKAGANIEAAAIENSFFGKSVSVAGLLTGRDVLRSLSELVRKDDVLLIPDVVMREGCEVFLDDLSKQDIEELLGIKAVIIESTPKGLIDAIASYV
ncbi:MAG TPA: DUF512 domain-containing protein, partial [Thermodesulfovibrionales bacterium]|nr:DUF512 domain-containing protein [Thermodesulfovibrionales bacterium]